MKKIWLHSAVPGNFVEYIIWHRLAEEWPYRYLTFICHGPSQLNFPFPVAFSGNNAVWKVSSVSNGIRVSCSLLGPDSSFLYAGQWWHTLNSRSQHVSPYVPNVPYVLCGSGCQGMFVSDAHFTFETGIQVLGCYQHIMCAGTGLGWDRVNFLHSIWYDAIHDLIHD